MREKYRLDDTTIVQLLTRGEELFKANLPKDITPAQVDVEVFGRKPGLITRATAAAGKGWLSPAMRGLESSVGLPKGSIAIPEDVEAQASYMGGLPKLAGQFGRDLPLAAATGGASKLLSLAPLKTDLLVGGVLGAAQPMLEEGRLPTLGEVGTSAGLVGGAGALLRRLLPTSRALKPGKLHCGANRAQSVINLFLYIDDMTGGGISGIPGRFIEKVAKYFSWHILPQR